VLRSPTIGKAIWSSQQKMKKGTTQSPQLWCQVLPKHLEAPRSRVKTQLCILSWMQNFICEQKLGSVAPNLKSNKHHFPLFLPYSQLLSSVNWYWSAGLQLPTKNLSPLSSSLSHFPSHVFVPFPSPPRLLFLSSSGYSALLSLLLTSPVCCSFSSPGSFFPLFFSLFILFFSLPLSSTVFH